MKVKEDLGVVSAKAVDNEHDLEILAERVTGYGKICKQFSEIGFIRIGGRIALREILEEGKKSLAT